MKLFKQKDSGEKEAGRSVRMGLTGSLICVLAVVAALLVNVVVGALPKTATQIDLSENDLYSLTDATKDLLKGLDKDVNIYYLAQTGSENSTVVTILNQYGSYSHVSWQQIDPAIYPNFAASYDAGSASAGSCIVECGSTYKLVDKNEYYDYVYDYETMNYTPTNLNIEENLSSAILYVTSSDGVFPKAYELTGHGETGLANCGDLASALQLQNIDLETLSILNVDEIPEDADLLIINAPQTDFASDDIAILQAYLDRGGNLLLCSGYDGNNGKPVKTPNLDALMEQYGMTGKDGFVVETDSNHYHRAGNTYLLPILNVTDATSGLNSTSAVMTPYAQAIELNEELDGVTVEALLTTSDKAFIKTSIESGKTELVKADDDEEGAFTVAAMAERKIDDNTESRVVWLRSMYTVYLTSADSTYGTSNGTFVLGCAAWLGNASEGILVGGKALDTTVLSFTASQIVWFALPFLPVIPVVMIVVGIVISVRRRMR